MSSRSEISVFSETQSAPDRLFWPRLCRRIAPLFCYALAHSMFLMPALAQKPGKVTVPPPRPAPTPKAPENSFDQNRLRYDLNDPAAPKTGDEDTCLLPPLSLVHSSTVTIAHLQVPAKAKSAYQNACAAIKDKKTESAEKHLRKAVQEYPKYPAAWVTLGQVLSAQQRLEEARSACSQASTADSTYVPAYLCLADIAVRAQVWDEVLKLSARALELDPSTNAVAYGYNAAASFNLHNLPQAENSALKALEIGKNNSGDPRVHFLLAQIYEAKGDPASEAAQLREYLPFASDPSDAAMVKQYLAALERRTGK